MNEHATEKLKHYLSFPGEKIHFIKRTAIITLVPAVLIITFIGTFFIILSYVACVYQFLTIPVCILTILVLVTSMLLLCLKVVVEWFFHIYIVTNKKILEVVYIPLSSYTVNDVFLEQVKCTEIDIRMQGFVREMLGIGDIAMTFDRPTHDVEFVLTNMTHARQICSLLTQLLMTPNAHVEPSQWYKNNRDHKFYMIDTILPTTTV